jgi:hypothetical protein
MIAADTKSIEVNGDVVRIRAEYDLTDRIAYLDAPPPQGRTLDGHSLARWQDGVLIVETSKTFAARDRRCHVHWPRATANVPRMGRRFRLRDVAAPLRVETDQLKQRCKVPKDWHGGCSAPRTAEGEPP